MTPEMSATVLGLVVALLAAFIPLAVWFGIQIGRMQVEDEMGVSRGTEGVR